MVDAGFAPPRPPNIPDDAPDVGAAADEAGGAELPPPTPPNSDGVELDAVAAAGVELEGVLASGFLKRLRPELPPAAEAPGVDDPAPPNRPGDGAADEVAALSLSPPPKLKPPSEGVADGCEAAGWEAGVDPPRLNEGGLLAGVVLGSPPPNSPPAGLGVSCEAEAAAGAAPPNRPGVGGVAPLFVSLEPAAAPKRAVVGVEALAGLLPPNKPGVEPLVGTAGFAAPPNKPDPAVLPPVWLLCPPREKADDAAGVCPPNKLDPGGGPAGVVEGRKDVLFAAGVAVGVEPVERN